MYGHLTNGNDITNMQLITLERPLVGEIYQLVRVGLIAPRGHYMSHGDIIIIITKKIELQLDQYNLKP